MTAGETDIQLVDHTGKRRYSFVGRTFHDRLIHAATSLNWFASTDSQKWDSYVEVHVSEQRVAEGRAADGMEVFEGLFAGLCAGGEQTIGVGAPKIAPLMQKLREPPASRPQRVLVLNTCRDKNAPRGHREPYAVGPLLAALAARELLLDEHLFKADAWQSGQPTCASYLNYLVGNEDHTKADDKVKATNRIRAMLLDAQAHGIKEITIADTGGIPEFKEVTRLLATLIFGESNVRVWRKSETVAPSDLQILSTPEAQIRHHLMLDRLLAEGSIETAYNVAAASRTYKKGEEPVGQLPGLRVGYQLLAGFQREYVGNKDGAMQKGRWPLKTKYQVPATLVAAMRAEEALRRGGYPQAITHTIEFFEWSFLAGLENLLRSKCGPLLEVSADKRIENSSLNTRDIALRLGLEWQEHVNGYTTATEAGRRTRPHEAAVLLRQNRDGSTEVGNKSRERQLWTQLMGSAKDPLEKLSAAIESGNHGELVPMNFRNAQAHNGYATTQSRYFLGNAIATFKKRELWADTVNTPATQTTALGDLFLNQPLVVAALKATSPEINEEPSKIYRDWILKLRDEVRECTLQ